MCLIAPTVSGSYVSNLSRKSCSAAGCCRGFGNRDTELFKPLEVVALKTRSPDPIKVVAAELVVTDFTLQHVICNDENGVSDGEAGSLRSSLSGNAALLG